jgi:hypothetical protein
MAISVYKRKLKKLEEENAVIENEDITSNLEHINSCNNEYFVVTSYTFSFLMVFIVKFIVIFHWENHIVNYFLLAHDIFELCKLKKSRQKKLVERELDEFVAPIEKQNVVKVKKFEKLVYPVGDVDAVTITVKEVEILESTAFLNDNIIDFYMK